MNIRLEPLTRGDFPKIRDWIDPEVFRIFKAPVDDRQLERLLSKEENGRPAEIGLRAVDAETDDLVGMIHAVIVQHQDLAHIQQMVVDPDRRSRGYGAAILEAFLELGFTQHRLNRVQLFTDDDNRAGITCYRKVGFQLDGRMREIIKTQDGYKDECVFSILRREWLGGGHTDDE